MMIVAEVSANHNGSFETAMRTIEAAAECGATHIKIQTFSPEKMAIPGYKIESGPWIGRDLVDLYKEAQTPYEWHENLFRYARSLGLEIFSTPFDASDVDFLEELDCPIYKIASFELLDLRLIKRAADTGKPLIISTGMASGNEIEEAVETARRWGCDDLTLLHCVSEYPAQYNRMNLYKMQTLNIFDPDRIGLSDHSPGTVAAVAAVALGADVIEKHFTLSRAAGGLDAKFSLEPFEFRQLVRDCNNAYDAAWIITGGEQDKSLRRSLYYAEDIKKGTVLANRHIKTARPALGRSPLELDRVLGTILSEDVQENDPVQAQ